MNPPPDADADADATVEVTVGELRALARSLRLMMAWGLVLSAVVVLSLWRLHESDQHQQATDARLAQVVADEVREAEVETAQACVDEHARYGLFEVAVVDLVEVAAIVGADAHLRLLGATPAEVEQTHVYIRELLPRQLGPILEAYPPPSCDNMAAHQVLAEADRRGG